MSLKKKPKAVIVGGSIAGVSCAHTLILAGWDVLVVEKSYAPPTGSPTGAGLGLDPLSLRLIQSWIKDPDLPHKATLPLTIDQVQITLLYSILLDCKSNTTDAYAKRLYIRVKL